MRFDCALVLSFLFVSATLAHIHHESEPPPPVSSVEELSRRASDAVPRAGVYWWASVAWGYSEATVSFSLPKAVGQADWSMLNIQLSIGDVKCTRHENEAIIVGIRVWLDAQGTTNYKGFSYSSGKNSDGPYYTSDATQPLTFATGDMVTLSIRTYGSDHIIAKITNRRSIGEQVWMASYTGYPLCQENAQVAVVQPIGFQLPKFGTVVFRSPAIGYYMDDPSEPDWNPGAVLCEPLRSAKSGNIMDRIAPITYVTCKCESFILVEHASIGSYKV